MKTGDEKILSWSFFYFWFLKLIFWLRIWSLVYVKLF